MSEGFRSFAQLLAPLQEPITSGACDTAAENMEEMHEPCACAHSLRESRLFRTRVAEAVDGAVPALLHDIAADVLARELAIAPADIAAIARRAIDRFNADEPLRVRLAASDANVTLPLPVHTDPQLMPGDAIIEFESGSVDARLGTRLACLLEAFA